MKVSTSIFVAAFYFLTPLSAMASDADFTICDGYGVPNLKGADGMSTENKLFGLTKGAADIRKAKGSVGQHGVEACDRALMDARMLPDYWVRRAHLLQAKALHQLAANSREAALETLAQSDTVGAEHDSIPFDHSIKLGNRLLRAFALAELGRADEASAQSEALMAERPFSAQIQNLALSAALKADNRLSTQLAYQKRIASIDPGNIEQLFWMNFLAGKYHEAAELGGQITFDLPRKRGGWTVEGEAGREYRLIRVRAELAGAMAYAQEALGRAADADRTISVARAELVDAAEPPPAPAPGKKLSNSVVNDYKTRTEFVRRGTAELEHWTEAIRLRRRLPNMTIDDLVKEFDPSMDVLKLPIMGDVFALLKTRSDSEKQESTKAAEDYYNRMEKARREELAWDVYDLRDRLPRPETERMQPKFKKAGDGYFLSDNGLSRREDKQNGTWTIRFTHNVAPGAMVEELAMLGAALTAREQGKDSFIVLSRRTIQRTTTVMGYYGGITGTLNSGYEAQLLVTFLDASVLPEKYANAGWRLIPAAGVIDALSRQYLTDKKATP